MTELSPSAKAVDDAFWKTINNKWNIYDRGRAQLAAALRAVADQLQMDEALGDTDADVGVFAAHHAIHAQLTAIALELEGAT
jgi:hypothetical protein